MAGLFCVDCTAYVVRQEGILSLNRLVLILICVIAAAGATIWLATVLSRSVDLPGGWLWGVPAALVIYVVVRTLLLRSGR